MELFQTRAMISPEHDTIVMWFRVAENKWISLMWFYVSEHSWIDPLVLRKFSEDVKDGKEWGLITERNLTTKDVRNAAGLLDALGFRFAELIPKKN